MFKHISIGVRAMPDEIFPDDPSLNAAYMELICNQSDTAFLTQVLSQLQESDTNTSSSVSNNALSRLTKGDNKYTLMPHLCKWFSKSNLQAVHTLLQKTLIAVYPPGKTTTHKRILYEKEIHSIPNEKCNRITVSYRNIDVEESNDDIIYQFYENGGGHCRNTCDIIPEIASLLFLFDVCVDPDFDGKHVGIRTRKSISTTSSAGTMSRTFSSDSERVSDYLQTSMCYEISNIENIGGLGNFGVYAIYYAGKKWTGKYIPDNKGGHNTSLNGFWIPTLNYPVFVGKSCTGKSTMLSRLKIHRKQLKSAGIDDQFVFSFFVCTGEEAKIHEKQMIEKLSCIWNHTKENPGMGIGFGKNWEVYYVPRSSSSSSTTSKDDSGDDSDEISTTTNKKNENTTASQKHETDDSNITEDERVNMLNTLFRTLIF